MQKLVKNLHKCKLEEMPHGSIVLVLVIIVALVAIIIPMTMKAKEPFIDYFAYSRDQYLDQGKGLFNKFSDTNDALVGNDIRNNEKNMKANNEKLQAATVNSDLQPDPSSGTFLGIKKDKTDYKIAPLNMISEIAKKNEAQKGRGACAMIDNPAFPDFGVCIKGGTKYNGENPGKHVGGMALLAADRDDEIENARLEGREPVFRPTAGKCPEGYFFANRTDCERAANRLDCSEAGEQGGFNNELVKAKCAQAPSAGDNVFIYDPKNRTFNANLRVLTPINTGLIIVRVFDSSNNILGSGQLEKGGTEMRVPVRGVRELQDLKVAVFMEVPHRLGGKQEAFQYGFWQNGSPDGMPRSSANKACERIGARPATVEEMKDAWSKGAQICSWGWTDTSLVFPMQARWEDGNPDHIGWCGTATLNQTQIADTANYKAWCYGVKPPASTSLLDFGYNSFIAPFFQSLGGNSFPSQSDKSNIWSEYGDDYQAPNARGVIMQWEGDGVSSKRIVPFEPTITAINGNGPTSVASDGTATFRVLRRMGSFKNSTIIRAPRPRSGSPMLTNQFWIWSNQPKSAVVYFNCKVPGILAEPFYKEDAGVATAGPLITRPETMNFMRTSPCLKEGQVAGKYSSECLTSLFVGSGGDLMRGKLAIESGGLARLNKLNGKDADMDDISTYLSNLYTLATTGRDSDGRIAGNNDESKRTAIINDAAQKLFGFDITSPCEDIAEDSMGQIIIVPKKSNISPDCLNYLWNNANSDRSRGDEDIARRSQLKNTYTAIGDRFSGLLKSEGSPANQAKYPFRACQTSGTMAPIKADGRQNPLAIATALAKGSIQAIQDFYNGIHKNANYLGNSGGEEVKAAHKLAVEQCYGIYKSPDAAGKGECGVPARYVRVLPTGIQNADIPGNSCIQIPQIEIFDAAGNNLSKGKKRSDIQVGSVWAGGSDGSWPERAVDGQAFLHGHGEGEYHDACDNPDNSYWTLDLGRTYKVDTVKFYPRTDCCTYRQLAAPIQLLDEGRKIVAQKLLGSEGNYPAGWGNVDILKFTAADTKPDIAMDALVPGTRVSLMTATSFDRYLRHAWNAFYAWNLNTSSWSTSNSRQHSTMYIRPALNGRAGYISIEPANFPGYYLRHSGLRCWLHYPDGSQIFKDDASFKIIPAVNGDPSMISFESSNYPNHYIATYRSDPTAIYITTVNKSSAFDVQRACWRAKNPLY